MSTMPIMPTINNVTRRLSYNIGPVDLSPRLTINPGDDSETLVGATVTITGGFAGDGEVLTMLAPGLGASYDPATETLTFSSNPTNVNAYQDALAGIAFAAGQNGANPSNFGANPTRTVTWTVNNGSFSSAPVTTTINVRTSPFDVNGDGVSDLVFQNSDGSPGVWLWDGSEVLTATGLANPGASWRIVTSGDVNGDGIADLIWQNSDGTPGIWLMRGPHPIEAVGLTNPGPSWHLVTSGDTNGDGNADLIWRNSDGTLGVWLMNGTTPIAESSLGNPGANWKVVGTADYNGDGNDDILLQDTTTGNLMIDLMNGTSISSTKTITVGDPSWHAVSTGTFNGQAVIAWQNSDGTPAVWAMNGTAPGVQQGFFNPGPGWQLVSIDHFSPDGHPDLLFQNSNGPMGIWDLSVHVGSITADSALSLPNPGPEWQSRNGHPFAAG